MSKKVEVPTMAATFLPLRSSIFAMPAFGRATMAPSTAVATPVTLMGAPSSNCLAGSANDMSMACTLRLVSWFRSGTGAPGTTEYSGCQPRFPSRSSLWMISVAAQPSCRYARRTLPLAWARSTAGAPSTAPAATAVFTNVRRESVMAARLLDLRHAAQRFLDLGRGVLVVLQLAAQVRLVGAQVEVAVARQVEEDRLLLA